MAPYGNFNGGLVTKYGVTETIYGLRFLVYLKGRKVVKK